MTVAISIAALAVSLSTFMTTRWRDKRDLLLRVHERLITPDQQHGRRLIYAMSASGTSVDDISEGDYTVINNVLSTLDNMAIYYRRRYISRKDILTLWAEPVVRVVRAAEPFLTHRDELVGAQTWPDLRAFASDAERYVFQRGIDIKAVEVRVARSPNPDVF